MHTETGEAAAFSYRLSRVGRNAGSREDGVSSRDYASARDYDEYRVKLYKTACRAARERREQLPVDREQYSREGD